MSTGMGVSKGSILSSSLIVPINFRRVQARYRAPKRERSLDVQVADVERVGLDELPPRLDLVAHQDGEDRVGLDVVLDPHLQEAAALGGHGGLPELLGGPLAQALVALDRQALL